MDNQQYYEDEINLRDYIEVILKYRWLIIGIFLISIITTAVITFRLPKTYKSDAMIEIARIEEPIYTLNESKHLIVSEKILKPVIDKYSSELDKISTIEQFRKKIEVQTLKNTHFINISFKYNNAKLAKKILHNIIESFFKYGHIEYKRQLNSLKENLKFINEKLESITVENKTGSLLNEKLKLAKNIRTAKGFSIINSPVIPASSISPKKKQNVAISGVVSLMFAVFLAFFIEFIRTSKPSEKGRR